MAVLLTLISILIISITIYFYNAFKYWKRKGVPYIQPNFPLGSINLSFGKYAQKSLGSMYYKFKSMGVKFGGLYIISRPLLILIDPDIIKTMLVKDFDSFMDRGIYCDEVVDPLSANLFALEGTKWKKMRTKLTPTFSSGKIKMLFSTVMACSKDISTVLDRAVNQKEPLDLRELTATYATDVIANCAFGMECNSILNPDTDFRKYGRMLVQTNLLEDIKFMIGIVKPKFLQALGIGDGFTAAEIAAQAFVFYFAGYETSSATMAFCLMELALNPGIQDKVREEINSVIEKYDGEITYDGIMDMQLLEKVINGMYSSRSSETMRLHPPFYMLNRICTKDYRIENTNIIIEKGTKVVIPSYAIQNDPEYYPNPEIFDPDRFSIEQTSKRHPCVFLPFGEGPRSCLGKRFGMLQTKIGIISLLRNYEYSIHEKTKLPINFISNLALLTVEEKVYFKVEKL